MQAERLLLELLEERGVDWTRENGYIRFRIRRGALCWEADCLCARTSVLIYGRCPMFPADRSAALELCNRANLRLCRGAMLLADDGRPVCRTEAAVDDIYDAAFRLREAVEENINAVVRWWSGFEKLTGPDAAPKSRT